MATANDKKINMLSLTDCLYFTNGFCTFKGKCRYRHCQAAIKQLEKCPTWPKSCRNIDCPYRHSLPATTISIHSPQERALVIFFWDIENVPIPKGQKPFDIVQRIRQKLVIEPNLQEVDFSCYCNSNSIPSENQQSLHHANVRIIHVPDRKPGAADRQIMLDLDRFERVHRPPATIVLISGDIDFVGKLSDLRHQVGFRVIVIHNKPAKEELKATVNEHYPWELFIEPLQQEQKPLPQPVLRNSPERSRKQSANLRPVLNDRHNNDNNRSPRMSPKLNQSPLMPVLDLLGENNLQQNHVWSPSPSTPPRRPASKTRNYRSNSRNRPRKPLVIQPVNQITTSKVSGNSPPTIATPIVGGSTPPTVATPIVAPRARLRHAGSTNQLNRQNISISSSCEQIPVAVNDDTEKNQEKSLLCPYCTNEFNTIKALRQHQKDKKHLFDCPMCKEGFPTSNGLKQHQISKGHGISNDINAQEHVQLGTIDNLNTSEFANDTENNSDMSNNIKRLPVYHSPIANYSIID